LQAIISNREEPLGSHGALRNLAARRVQVDAAAQRSARRLNVFRRCVPLVFAGAQGAGIVLCQISDIVGRGLVADTKDFAYFSRAVLLLCQFSDSLAPIRD